MRSSAPAFPVGLYGTLLLALCWLLLPALFQPLERLLLGVASLPHAWLGPVLGEPALAADLAVRHKRLQLQEALEERSILHDVESARALLPPTMTPLLCKVVAVDRVGGGGLPSELRLDRSYRELRGCADLVTNGDVLLGFLARPGVGTAVDDEQDDPARVLLLNHPQGRDVAASMPVAAGVASQPGQVHELRCVVEAASAVDRWPLRTTLHDDPYRAAQLRSSGAMVRTLQLSAPWTGALPKGLRLGHSRIWGYERSGEVLSIGVYVEPVFDPRALSQVVLWQTVPGESRPVRQPSLAPARLWPLPDGTQGRWLLTSDVDVLDGAAVVQDGICLGTARGVAFGQGLVTSFQSSRHPWALWLLPDDESRPPVGIYGEVVRTEGAVAWFKPRDQASIAVAGFVFTGGGQARCPAGLLIGRAEPVSGSDQLRIVVPRRSGSQVVELIAEEP